MDSGFPMVFEVRAGTGAPGCRLLQRVRVRARKHYRPEAHHFGTHGDNHRTLLVRFCGRRALPCGVMHAGPAWSETGMIPASLSSQVPLVPGYRDPVAVGRKSSISRNCIINTTKGFVDILVT